MGTSEVFQFEINIIFIKNHDQVKASFFLEGNMNSMLKTWLMPSLSSFWGGGPFVFQLRALGAVKL